MNKFNLFITLISFLILSCNAKKSNYVFPVQKIDNLDLNLFSKNGEKIYSISSPSSNFDIGKDFVYLKKLKFMYLRMKNLSML